MTLPAAKDCTEEQADEVFTRGLQTIFDAMALSLGGTRTKRIFKIVAAKRGASKGRRDLAVDDHLCSIIWTALDGEPPETIAALAKRLYADRKARARFGFQSERAARDRLYALKYELWHDYGAAGARFGALEVRRIVAKLGGAIT